MKRATYENQLRRLPLPASPREQSRLLDCGAANGYLVELAKDIGWDSFAIELSEWGADACTRLIGPNRVYRGQVQEASFAANPEVRFEAITLFDFLEHVRDPLTVLDWAHEHLAAEGALLLTTPRVGSISWYLMGAHWFHYTREHLWYFTPLTIRLLLAKTGFKQVNVYPAFKAVTVGYALAHYRRKSSYSALFSPPARVLESLLPTSAKAWRLQRAAFKICSRL
jgi:hypothetical protein